MKIRPIISAAMVIVAIATWSLQAMGDDATIEQQKNYYLQRIDAEIENYSCKVHYIVSRSPKLHRYGENAALRAGYLSKHKDILVQEMVLQKVNTRPYAVHQYLLHRCNEEIAAGMAKKGLTE